MADLRFTKDHEWVRLDGDTVTIGITDYAQDQLGDVVFVELPEVGAAMARGGEAAVVESVKAASEIYAPVSGQVVSINQALTENPGLVNDSAMADGWFLTLSVTDRSEFDALMDEAAYQSYLKDLG